MVTRRPAGREVPGWLVLVLSWIAGSVPFSQLMARARRGVDLRTVGSGTVSGTSLYAVAGFGPLAVAGVAEVAKGAVGPALAGRDRPGLAAAAGGAAVVGHNWSPWLAGAGGRGISPAMGALVVRQWPGTAVLGAGMGFGRLAGETALGSAISFAALGPVLRRWSGRDGVLAAAAVVVPLVAKRLAGNRAPARRSIGVYLTRLLYDRDERVRADVADDERDDARGGP